MGKKGRFRSEAKYEYKKIVSAYAFAMPDTI